MTAEHTRQAVEALRTAVAEEQDFPMWLAMTLATVARDLPGGAMTLVSNRPGSWEAEHVFALGNSPVTFDVD